MSGCVRDCNTLHRLAIVVTDRLQTFQDVIRSSFPLFNNTNFVPIELSVSPSLPPESKIKRIIKNINVSIGVELRHADQLEDGGASIGDIG